MSKKLLWPGEINEELVTRVWAGGWSQLVLCSEGGDIYCARGVCDYLLKEDKEVLVVGKCFSSATAIASCGNPCIAAPGTRFMVHEPHIEDLGGRRDAVEREATELKTWLNWYLNLLAQRTETDRETWEDLISAETYFGAKLAFELGLVDRVL